MTNEIIPPLIVALVVGVIGYLVRIDRKIIKLDNKVIKIDNIVENLTEIKELASRQITQIGEVDFPEKEAGKFYDNLSVGKRIIGVHVIFDTPFSKQPRVSVSLRKFDLGDPKANIHRINVTAEKIGTKGFTLYFETWHESQIYSAAASWIAIGE